MHQCPRNESDGLASVCKLIGHQSASFFLKSQKEFKEICKYLASADRKHATKSRDTTLFIHISCHGDNKGLSFGSDHIGWNKLVEDIEPILDNEAYKGGVALSISACGSGNHTLSKYLNGRIEKNGEAKMPEYIFSITHEEVNWDDALVAWVLLYHKLSTIPLKEHEKIKEALKEVYEGTKLKFKYHRWDAKYHKYRKFQYPR